MKHLFFVPLLLLPVFAWCAPVLAEDKTPAVSAPRIAVEGYVFQDDNGNGQRDAGEKALAGIVVSDGLHVTQTDARGHYALADVDAADRHFVFVVTPSGYRHPGAFYHPLPASGDAANISFALVPDPQAAKPDFSFFQITDTHVVSPLDTLNMLDLLAQLRAFKPVFVVNTGDLVDDGRSISQVDNYAKAMCLSPLEIYNVPGNHDLDSPSNRHYDDVMGPERYAFDYGGRHFLILNSICDVDRQYEWMKKELAMQPPEKELLVFQHYPPEKRLMEFLAHYKTLAIFSGHLHSSRVFMYGKTLYVNTPPFRFGSIDFSPRTARQVSFRAGEMVLDDVYPHAGLRDVWAAGVARPTPEPDAAPPRPGQDWPMFQHDPARTGLSGDKVAPPLKLAWRRTLDATLHVSSPVAAGGTVYIGVGDEENRGRAGIYALDAASGNEKWRHKTSSSVRNTVAVAGDLVYATTVEGQVIALDAAAGSLKWSYDIDSLLQQSLCVSPVVAGNVVYVGTSRSFVALEAATGKRVWQAKSMGGGWDSCLGSPALGGGMVFDSFTWTKGLFALDAKSGEQRWHYDEFSDGNVVPTFVDGTVYAVGAGWNGGAHAFDAQSGKEKWKFTVGAGRLGFSAPVVTGNTVLLGSADGKVFGLDIDTGKPRWVYEPKEVSVRFSFAPYSQNKLAFSSPAVSGKTAYLGNSAGWFVALDTQSGKELWSCDLGAPIVSSPAVSGNAVYIATFDGTVYAFTSGKKAPPIDAAQYTWTPCDLAALLNRPLKDDVDGDGKGGWTDQGAQTDLRNLHAGDHTYNGVAFRVAEGNACFIAKNKFKPSENLPDRGTAPLKARADVLAFLHSGGWLTAGVRHSTYVIHYADGKKVEIPVIGGKNIFDWTILPSTALWGLQYDPALGFTQDAAAVPVPSFGSAYVWMTLWKNPRPDAEIQSFEVLGANEGIPGLIALSRGEAKK
jgi:outer membrane protein assembly factor BamB/predicted phosphodiesterase